MHQIEDRIIQAIILGTATAILAVGIINGPRVTPEVEEIVVQEVPEVVTPDEPKSRVLQITNPIDFAAYWEINPDVYAYLYVDGTNVDYPILQSATDDYYYLEYNIDGSKGYPGCIYTEKANAKDFTDPNTVIYGHNMRNGSMFHTLHDFEDETFFNEHKYVYIYTPESVLQYRIFAVHTSDSSHILNTHNFVDPEEFQTYLTGILAETDGYIDETVAVTNQDKIITMSTCTGNDDTRWLVQAVLVNTFDCPYGTSTNLQLPLEDETTFDGAKPIE